MEDILVKGGLIVNADATFRADILLKGGRISRVSESISGHEQDCIVDASGKLVIPGGIDPHVHLALPGQAGCSVDDYFSGSKAAIRGGTTTLIDFVTPGRGELLTDALHIRREQLAVGNRQPAVGCCNIFFHMGITAWQEHTAMEMRRCVEEEGIMSFKVYLAYLDSIGIDYKALEMIMITAASIGATVAVHCEDGAAISLNIQRLREEGKLDPGNHAVSRPANLEAAAVEKVLELAARTGCRVYIVHVSCAQSLKLIAEAKLRGVQVEAETCPHYLLFDDSVYSGNATNVLPFVLSPPIRSKSDQEALWNTLSNGTLDVVSTDHCPFNLSGQKDLGLHDFTKIPNGTGGIGFRLSLLYTYGVLKNRITLNRWVELCSANPARLFGMANSKGRIAEGMDADLVVWNPAGSSVIRASEQALQCDHTIYEGLAVQGGAETVILSGRILFQALTAH